MVLPAWRTDWSKFPDCWVDYPNSVPNVMKAFDSIITEVPKLKRYAQTANQLKELPWKEIANRIADGVSRTDERLDSAERLMSVEKLRDYVECWRTQSDTVDKLIRWELLGDDGPKKLTELSKPGAYVGDFMFTLLAIERRAILSKSQYVAIKKDTYVQLAKKLGLGNDYYSSPNNTGNVMEALFWFAYEQKRYDFIMTVVTMATEVEYPGSGPGDTKLQRELAASAHGHADGADVRWTKWRWKH